MNRTSSPYRCIALAVCVALTWGVVGPVVHHACAAMHGSDAHAPSGVHASHDVEGVSSDSEGESCETDAERHRDPAAAPSAAAHASDAVSANDSPAAACCCRHGTVCDEGTTSATTRCCTIQTTPTDAPDAVRASMSSIHVQVLVATVARIVALRVDDGTVAVPAPTLEEASPPPVRLHVWTNTFLN